MKRFHCLTLTLALLVATGTVGADSHLSPQAQWALRDLPEHSVPLFAVGDVDENGTVDGDDLLLIDALAAAGRGGWDGVAGVSCIGAADLDMDADVDADDSALGRRLLEGGARITRPALFFQNALPCRFERLIAAAQIGARPGDEVPIYILRPGYDQNSSRVTVEAGTGSVSRDRDPRAFVLEVGRNAGEEVVELTIELGDEERYGFFLQVVPRR